MIYPRFKADEFLVVCEAVKSVTKRWIEAQKLNAKDTTFITLRESSDASDDAMFLLHLGFKTNWRANCSICRVKYFMGTLCCCGHTEIAVFKPCGHAMCATPCFEKLMTTLGVTLAPKTLRCEGQTYQVGNQKELNFNVCDLKTLQDTEFGCPVCHIAVTRVFRAEDVRLPKADSEQLQKDVIVEIGDRVDVSDPFD